MRPPCKIRRVRSADRPERTRSAKQATRERRQARELKLAHR
jgi:hypothetical protein